MHGAKVKTSKTLWALVNSSTEVKLLSDFLIVAAEF
jgi:hypothetical protein